MSAIVRALLDELEPDDLAVLAERLAPFLPSPSPSEDGWLTSAQAARYAGCTVNALHKAMAAREVEFAQAVPGGKCHFRRAALDAWRRG